MKRMKKYDKPVVKVAMLVTSALMVTSFPFDDDEADASDALSTKRRGRWGDLWYDGDYSENE